MEKRIKFSRNAIQNTIVLGALIILIIIFSTISGQFFSLGNFHSILLTMVPIGLITIGEGLCLMAGYFEMSVGMVASFAGLIAASIMASTGSVALSFIGALSIGALMGLAAGYAVGKLKMNAFITTFALQQIYRGIIYLFTDGGFTQSLAMETYKPLTRLGQLKVLGILQFPIVIMLVIYLLFYFIFKYTKLGRSFYLIGSNARAARICGIQVHFSRIMVFVICDVLAALAGVLFDIRMASAAAFIGNNYCMEAIAAAVLGGTAAGKGNLFMSFIGVLIIYVIKNGLIMIGIPDAYQNMAIGLILFAAVLAQVRRKSE